MNNYRPPYPNELYHHGILGQKWGVQNGPPYPLDVGDHSKAEKLAARAEKEKQKAQKKIEKSDSKLMSMSDEKLVKTLFNKSGPRNVERFVKGKNSKAVYEEEAEKLQKVEYGDPNDEIVKIFEDYTDKYITAALTDAGFYDSPRAHEFIKNKGYYDWKAGNLFDVYTDIKENEKTKRAKAVKSLLNAAGSLALSSFTKKK